MQKYGYLCVCAFVDLIMFYVSSSYVSFSSLVMCVRLDSTIYLFFEVLKHNMMILSILYVLHLQDKQRTIFQMEDIKINFCLILFSCEI